MPLNKFSHKIFLPRHSREQVTENSHQSNTTYQKVNDLMKTFASDKKLIIRRFTSKVHIVD